MTFEPFDILNAPLSGTNLIEASAGTGKTYTIAGLYLRLIVEKGLTIDQILVVTFTKAATEELKQRIRDRLLEARQAFKDGRSSEELLGRLVHQSRNPMISLARITDAIRDFDACAIFTIHGFCQRILHENAFETGSLFDTELITEQRDLLLPICEDFWRLSLYDAPPEFIRYALLKLRGPDTLLKLLLKSKDPNLQVIPQQQRPTLYSLEGFVNACQSIEEAWPTARDAVETLLNDPALNGTTYGSFKADKHQPDMTVRQVNVKDLVAAMDGFCENAALRFPLFKAFDKFTATTIELKTKKGQITPIHRFFNLCDDLNGIGEDLEQEMQALLLFVKADLFRFAREKLPLLKREKNVQYFDDLLTRVNDALSKPGAELLSAAVKHRFRAALVDEFQDTDMLQYTIFSQLFSDNEGLFFMIGDPKQAIYGFRGADIFSYMHASSQAKKRYTLLTNYRSPANLITAVNTLFSRVKKPFVFAEIPFAKGMAAENSLHPQKNTKSQFQIWFTSANNGKPLNKDTAEHIISAGVSKEIHNLINGPESMNPGDIAILVRTNRQAGIVKQDLSRNNVPAVIYSAGNVFETREARDLFLLMMGISDPFNAGHFRAAITTSIMGVAFEKLDLVGSEQEWQDPLQKCFTEYHQMWLTDGFMRMFNRLMVREHVRARLLGMREGERRLTNLLHMAELLHDNAVHNNLGMPALIKWFSIQRDPQSGMLETHQLRLESDALTAKIITIHKSKGLEFPVVFCPFAWGASLIRGTDFIFHDRGSEQRLTLDLGSPGIEDNRAQAQYELLAENLRLLYVALTRAQERCILVWGRINTVETSALAYLLHYHAEDAAESSSTDLLQEIQFQYRSKDEKALFQDLKALETASNQSIQVSMLSDVMEGGAADKASLLPKTMDGMGNSLSVRKMNTPMERDWHIYSYSSLTSSNIELPSQVYGFEISQGPVALGVSPDKHQNGELQDSEQPDRDEAMGFDEGSVIQPDDHAKTEGHTIFTFTKGANAGIFFHDLFEHFDFVTIGEPERETFVADKIKAYGIDPLWQDAVLKMIENVLTVPLQSHHDEFSLSMIKKEQRINEMEFYFPLNKISKETLQNTFAVHGGGSRLAGFPEHLGRLQFTPAKGFMKGFIDLVFGFNGRYYLVDWKSNHLGYVIEDYESRALDDVMQRSYYALQYHIYTLALHLYLQLRIPGYQYEKDFGGVFYLFIRGIDKDAGPGCGVFFDRPDKELVDALENAMLPT